MNCNEFQKQTEQPYEYLSSYPVSNYFEMQPFACQSSKWWVELNISYHTLTLGYKFVAFVPELNPGVISHLWQFQWPPFLCCFTGNSFMWFQVCKCVFYVVCGCLSMQQDSYMVRWNSFLGEMARIFLSECHLLVIIVVPFKVMWHLKLTSCCHEFPLIIKSQGPAWILGKRKKSEFDKSCT